MSSRKTAFCHTLLLTAIVLFFAGCVSKDLGAAIPADAPVVKLADVRANPADYDGKAVLLKGIISSQCPSLCEFTYKEGTQSTLVFPMGFKFPKLDIGAQVTLYAEITNGTGQVVVTALGMKLK